MYQPFVDAGAEQGQKGGETQQKAQERSLTPEQAERLEERLAGLLDALEDKMAPLRQALANGKWRASSHGWTIVAPDGEVLWRDLEIKIR